MDAASAARERVAGALKPAAKRRRGGGSGTGKSKSWDEERGGARYGWREGGGSPIVRA